MASAHSTRRPETAGRLAAEEPGVAIRACRPAPPPPPPLLAPLLAPHLSPTPLRPSPHRHIYFLPTEATPPELRAAGRAVAGRGRGPRALGGEGPGRARDSSRSLQRTWQSRGIYAAACRLQQPLTHTACRIYRAGIYGAAANIRSAELRRTRPAAHTRGPRKRCSRNMWLENGPPIMTHNDPFTIRQKAQKNHHQVAPLLL